MIKSISINDQSIYEKYLYVRWFLLRKPLGGALGSETDSYEAEAFHMAVIDSNKEIIGVGRIHFIDSIAQIRYMAITNENRTKGYGSNLMKELEKIALENKIKKIFLNSRISAVDFYLKNGYQKIKKVNPSFGDIIHYRMEKIL